MLPFTVFKICIYVWRCECHICVVVMWMWGEYLPVCLIVVSQLYKKERLLKRLIFLFQSESYLRHQLKYCSLTLLKHPCDNIYLKLNTRKCLCNPKHGYGSLCQDQFYVFVCVFFYQLPWSYYSPKLMLSHRLFFPINYYFFNNSPLFFYSYLIDLPYGNVLFCIVFSSLNKIDKCS